METPGPAARLRPRIAAVALVAAAACSIGCGGTRRVGGAAAAEPAGVAEAGASTAEPGRDGEGAAVSAPAPAEPVPAQPVSAAPASVGPAPPAAPSPAEAPPAGARGAPSPAVAAEPVAAVSIEAALRSALVDLTRAAARRRQFARAVAKISAELGVPIKEEQAMREMPCGGWSGPDCSNMTRGLEIARACAPVIASFHRKRTAEIATVLAEAVSVHAIWHDAYGYVRRVKKKGPGYTYAGCLFSRCDPADLENGQVDGVLYQVGRLLGALTGPACGPECKLGDL